MIEWTDCINYLLTISQSEVFKEMSASLAEHDITPVQCGVLNCIHKQGLTTPAEIATALHLENSSISGVLSRMEKKKLITREISTVDRRQIQVNMTDKSRALMDKLMVAVDSTDRKVMAPFTEEQGAALKDALRILANNTPANE